MIAKKKIMNINKLSDKPLQIPLQFLPDLFTACKEKCRRLNLKIILLAQTDISAISKSNKSAVLILFTHLQKMGFVWS